MCIEEDTTNVKAICDWCDESDDDDFIYVTADGTHLCTKCYDERSTLNPNLTK